MVTVVFKHQSSNASSLSIAGNFTGWNIVPMIKNDAKKQWEYEIAKESLEKFSATDQKPKLFFKFVENGSNWFTDENFAKETDANGNVNNVLVISSEDEDDNRCEQDRDVESEFSENEVTPPPTKSRTEQDSPVMVSDSDVESYRDATTRQGETEDESDDSVKGSRDLTTGTQPSNYTHFLHRVIVFFKNLFYGWFGMGSARAP
ncbi:LAMI_0D10066g1_1 [Lachancea mirantina]|uniref:LAMI_0D10066g1_1 n=1 Tax=Lachancea mirantina TaxID=1230905 RepID=A0A1G4JE03_9SACH|nr:LAMI_0D10066g1_1 [Lachancea mirantina]